MRPIPLDFSSSPSSTDDDIFFFLASITVIDGDDNEEDEYDNGNLCSFVDVQVVFLHGLVTFGTTWNDSILQTKMRKTHNNDKSKWRGRWREIIMVGNIYQITILPNQGIFFLDYCTR